MEKSIKLYDDFLPATLMHGIWITATRENYKKANQDLEFTKDQVLEIQKCMEDPQYFVENYIKIVSLDKGLVPFDLYDYQKDFAPDCWSPDLCSLFQNCCLLYQTLDLIRRCL